MSTTFWIIAGVIAFDMVFLPVLLWALVGGGWNPLADAYPAQEPAPDALRKNFQSYKVGLLNLGYMVHTAIDDRYLHLRPAWLGRAIKMRPVSVPWEDIAPVKRRGKKYAEVKVGLHNIIGPRWALELAFADHDEGSEQN